MGYTGTGTPTRRRRKRPTLREKADLAISLGQAKPDHEWMYNPKTPGKCARCHITSPFSVTGIHHPYTVREWP